MANVAVYLANAIQASRKPQYQIAREAGFRHPNVLSMIKTGHTQIPLARIGAIAKALDIDARDLLQRCMLEYHPEIWAAIVEIFDSKPT